MLAGGAPLLDKLDTSYKNSGFIKITNFFMSAGIEKKKFSSNKISSLHFMAPERLMGELNFTQVRMMGKADTWAIGVILYFLLLGDLPFVGSSVSKLVKTIKKGKLKKVD